MLKEISAKQLRKGMYLKKICGSWLKQPFWKQSFLLDSQSDIDSIVQSGIETVVIDISKGLDVEDVTTKPDSSQQHPKANDTKAEQPQKVSLEAEYSRAKKICDQAKDAVQDMFQEVRMGKVVDIDKMKPIVKDISYSVVRNPSALINVARLKTMDDYTYMHSVAVCAMMTSLAIQLGLSEKEVLDAAQGGL